MWIVLFEEGEEGVISEVLEARGQVSHDVHDPWDEANLVTVVPQPLVLAGKMT